MAFAFLIVDALCCLTVHVDRAARMACGIGSAASFFAEALAAGLAGRSRIGAANGNVTFAAIVILVIHTACYGTI